MNNDLRAIGFYEMRQRITGNRLAVYDQLLRSGPRTAVELAGLMGWDKCSVRPRLSELCELLHVVQTGNRRNSEHEFRALNNSELLAVEAQRNEVLAANREQPAQAGQVEMFV